MKVWVNNSYTTLQKPGIIQKLVALLLLVVFTISFTPEHLFHDALATHTDQPVCPDEDKAIPHLHNPTFHCSFDDLVVSVPYLGVTEQPAIEQPEVVVIPSVYISTEPLSTRLRYTESRGPPMI